MIRVTVELVPPDGRSRELARCEITNQSGDGPTADYACRFVTIRPDGDIGVHNKAVLDYPRRRWNAWGLVFAALTALDAYGMETENRVDPELGAPE
jgi:hypothetical protein